MNKPKLVLLYGFASSGKTTLSKKYLSEHPLSISIEGDQIISMMGQWRENEDEAREIVFEDTQAIVRIHLAKSRDVLLPYLLTDHRHAETFEKIAEEMSAYFFEVKINTERSDAIERLLIRGTWGEEGSPELTEADLLEINALYDAMEKAMSHRSNVQMISSDLGDIDGTYSKFIEALT